MRRALYLQILRNSITSPSLDIMAVTSVWLPSLTRRRDLTLSYICGCGMKIVKSMRKNIFIYKPNKFIKIYHRKLSFSFSFSFSFSLSRPFLGMVHVLQKLCNFRPGHWPERINSDINFYGKTLVLLYSDTHISIYIYILIHIHSHIYTPSHT